MGQLKELPRNLEKIKHLAIFHNYVELSKKFRLNKTFRYFAVTLCARKTKLIYKNGQDNVLAEVLPALIAQEN